MIPVELFYDLVDAQAGFRAVVREPGVGDRVFHVTAATGGVLHLAFERLKVTGSGPAILQRLNLLLAPGYCTGEFDLDCNHAPYLDIHSEWLVRVIPNKGRRGHDERPPEYRIVTKVLYSSSASIMPRRCILELDCNGKRTIRSCETDDGLFWEVERLSRFAMPKEEHELVAGTGVGWSDPPSAPDSFAEMYGEDALDLAMAIQHDTLP